MSSPSTKTLESTLLLAWVASMIAVVVGLCGYLYVAAGISVGSIVAVLLAWSELNRR